MASRPPDDKAARRFAAGEHAEAHAEDHGGEGEEKLGGGGVGVDGEAGEGDGADFHSHEHADQAGDPAPNARGEGAENFPVDEQTG